MDMSDVDLGILICVSIKIMLSHNALLGLSAEKSMMQCTGSQLSSHAQLFEVQARRSVIDR